MLQLFLIKTMLHSKKHNVAQHIIVWDLQHQYLGSYSWWSKTYNHPKPPLSIYKHKDVYLTRKWQILLFLNEEKKALKLSPTANYSKTNCWAQCARALSLSPEPLELFSAREAATSLILSFYSPPFSAKSRHIDRTRWRKLITEEETQLQQAWRPAGKVIRSISRLVWDSTCARR